MSYEPLLIIDKTSLELHLTQLVEEQYSENDDVSRVAKYLINVLDSQTISFYPDEPGALDIVICHPEFTTFNLAVREKLDYLGVYLRSIAGDEFRQS